MAPSLSALMPGFTTLQYPTRQTERLWKTAKRHGSNSFHRRYESMPRDKHGIPQGELNEFIYTLHGLHVHQLTHEACTQGDLHTSTKDMVYHLAPHLRNQLKQTIPTDGSDITKEFPGTLKIQTHVKTVFNSEQNKPDEEITIEFGKGTLKVVYKPDGKIQESFSFNPGGRSRLSTKSNLNELYPRNLINGKLIRHGFKTLSEYALQSLSSAALSSSKEFEALMSHLNPEQNSGYNQIEKLLSKLSDHPALYQNLRDHYGFKAPDPRITRQKRAENMFQQAKMRYRLEVERQQPDDVFLECNQPNVFDTVYADSEDRRRVTLSPNHRSRNPYTPPIRKTSRLIPQKIWSHFNPDTISFDNISHQDYRRFTEAKDMIWRVWNKKKEYDKLQKQKFGAAEIITIWYRRRKDINSLATKMLNTAEALKKEANAAKTIQRFYRGYQGREQAKALKAKKNETALNTPTSRGNSSQINDPEPITATVNASKRTLPRLTIRNGKPSFSRGSKPQDS